MATSDPRKNLLTAKLDFEAVDGGPIKTSAISDESLDEWGFNLDPAKIESKENDKVDKTVASVPVSPALQTPPMIPLSQKAARVGANQKKSPPPDPPRRKTVTVRKKDNFAQYAASVILLAFIGITVAIYTYVNRAPTNDIAISYAALPEAVVNIDGQVTRMQVTIQVDNEDLDWLQENKKNLNDIFQVAVSTTEPDALRTPEGFTTMQNNLKKRFNTELKTDKVQAVLLTELLLQDKS